MAKRRGRGEDSVFYDHEGTPCKDATFHRSCRGRWRGQIDLGKDATGKRRFRRMSGHTKTEVYDKLDAAHKEIDQGRQDVRDLHDDSGRGTWWPPDQARPLIDQTANWSQNDHPDLLGGP